MMRQFCVLAVLALCACAAATGGSRTLEESLDWSPGQRLVIDFPVGSLRIEAGSADAVGVRLEAECRWSLRRCDEALQDLRLESSSSERRLRIEIDTAGAWSASKLEVEARITVPRAADLEVDMGVGELEIEGVRGEVAVDMGVGECTLYLDADAVGSVALDVGIGESQLRGTGSRVRERRSLLIGSEVFWDDGPGTARVDAELGVGEISVFLD